MRSIGVYFCFLGFIVLLSCKNPQQSQTNTSSEEEAAHSLDTLHLALDWRPNVLHSGLFYALAQSAFDSAGIYLKWDTPEIDNYTKKPLYRLLDGEVDLAIGPSEHLLTLATDSLGSPRAQAVATILQSDRSAFVVKKSSGIQRPADLETKTYLGYHTPLEDAILGAMVEHNGGQANFKTVTPGRLQVWEAFARDSGDVAWVFLHWEALQVEQAGDSLISFIPNEYGVPYGYSSVIMAPKNLSTEQEELIRSFLKVCAQAYTELQAQPEEALDLILAEVQHRNFRDTAFIARAFANILPHFSTQGSWGHMETEKWIAYIQWLKERGLLPANLAEPNQFYTNRLLSP